MPPNTFAPTPSAIAEREDCRPLAERRAAPETPPIEAATVLAMRYTNVSEPAVLDGRYDVVICGASFAGLAAARELTGSGAAVLVLDRYALGERPTSACGIPTDWLRELGMIELELQRFGELVVHTRGDTTVLDLPYTFSTFNYDEMCRLLWRGCDADFEIATVTGRGAEENGDIAVETDRGTVHAPLVVDALGWRRILAEDDGFQPP